MRLNFKVLILSIIFTAASLSGYFLFNFVKAQPIVIGVDICISIFSSSIFVVITSVVGYFVEKFRLITQIYDCTKNLQIINSIVEVSVVENNESRFTRENVKSIILTQQSEMNKMYVLLNEYSPLKVVNALLDGWIKYNNYLNEKLQGVYFDNSSAASFAGLKHFDLNELIDNNTVLIKQLTAWLKSKKFKFPNDNIV